MSALQMLQRDILADLMVRGDPALKQISAHDGLARERFDVYRNNVRSNYLASLRASFPVVCRLVGDAYFDYLAGESQSRHPSRSGDLLAAGEPFPAVLDRLHGGGEFGYLTDVARFEWVYQESRLAEGHAPLDTRRLASVPGDRHERLRFKLHPALRLFEASVPAYAIWQANVGDAEPEVIDLTTAQDCLAVLTVDHQTSFLPLSTQEWSFLAAVGQGASLADALADSGAGGLDAAAALTRFVAHRVIVDFID
jgi:hypothetical protein